MAKTDCDAHNELAKEAYEHLQKINHLTHLQMDAFEAGEKELFMQLDRRLENAMGEKERMIDRLRQHDEEHACQDWPTGQGRE